MVGTIKGGQSAREINRVHALNMRDTGVTVIKIAHFLEMTPRTIINICNNFEEGGIERALYDDPRPGGRRNLMRECISRS